MNLGHCAWCRWRNGLWFLLIWDINHQEDQKRKKMETLLIWRKESRNFSLSQTTSQKDHWCVNAFNPWILWIQVFFRLSTMYYTITNTTQEKKNLRIVSAAQYGIRKQHEIFASHFCFDFYYIEFTLFRKWLTHYYIKNDCFLLTK